MKKEIFIIDDDMILRLIVQKMINHIDPSAICHQCENGEIGLDALLPCLDSENQIIVLLDLNMPVLDGWEVLDCLENSDFLHRKFFTLYILSSSTDESDILKASEYGLVQKFYHKPLNSASITEILNG
jgi:DNA-binding NarL/FixJ family response regulator